MRILNNPGGTIFHQDYVRCNNSVLIYKIVNKFIKVKQRKGWTYPEILVKTKS